MSFETKTALHRWILRRCQDLSPDSIPDRVLVVSINHQTLSVCDSNGISKVYSISTSKNPPSNVENSFGTPIGLHQVADKLGDCAPAGTVFKAREPIGHVDALPPEAKQRNLVTSRIMRLRGMETGNTGPGQDSYDRYIYIHGTQHEHRVGEPFSGGCVEMKNADVIELFSNTPQGTWVAIDHDILNS